VKFYNRKNELKKLSKIESLSHKNSQMTIIIGRRRIGKTTLVKEAFKKKVYFFVAKKDESLLCEEYVDILSNSLNIKIFGEFKKFSKLFEYILEISKSLHFTLIIDEFQEFIKINPSIYSEMQNLWDSYKYKSKLNLVLCGSIYSLMKKIFENKKEPLFGRVDNKIMLKPFDIITQKEILLDHNKNLTNIDLLSFYILTGGVAKYIEIFIQNRAFNFDAFLNTIFDEDSLFLDEGKNLLIEEFGKDYTVYFSILSLMASSKTSRSEIESILQKDIGGYLDRLENEYNLVRKVRPIFSKEGSRNVKYEIIDNFLSFWFRFIYKYKSSIEIENYDYVKEIVKRDFNSFAGKFLEKYFMEKLKLTKKYSQIGSYWERGNKNEIDIVALNERDKILLISEVKLNQKRLSKEKLIKKSIKLTEMFKDYKIKYMLFSLDDMLRKID